MSMGWTVVWLSLGLLSSAVMGPTPAALEVGPAEERSVGQELQEVSHQAAVLGQSV